MGTSKSENHGEPPVDLQNHCSSPIAIVIWIIHLQFNYKLQYVVNLLLPFIYLISLIRSCITYVVVASQLVEEPGTQYNENLFVFCCCCYVLLCLISHPRITNLKSVNSPKHAECRAMIRFKFFKIILFHPPSLWQQTKFVD